MFQFPRFPLPVLCIRAGVTPHDGCRVSPFGHPRIEARSAAPRGLSQPPTSFFGIRRQGIHRWLFVAWRTKMLVLAMEFSRGAASSLMRTSYHRVCLAFHPYPQVIPPVFNLGGFGPPRGLTPASACPWIDHSASGLPRATGRPIQTRFRSGSPSRVNLATYRNSLAHSSKGAPSRRRVRRRVTTL